MLSMRGKDENGIVTVFPMYSPPNMTREQAEDMLGIMRRGQNSEPNSSHEYEFYIEDKSGMYEDAQHICLGRF